MKLEIWKKKIPLEEKSSIFGQNKYEEEKDKLFENSRIYIEYFFKGQGSCNNYGHLFGKYRRQILKLEKLCPDYHISSYQVNFQSQSTMLIMLLQLPSFN